MTGPSYLTLSEIAREITENSADSLLRFGGLAGECFTDLIVTARRVR